MGLIEACSSTVCQLLAGGLRAWVLPAALLLSGCGFASAESRLRSACQDVAAANAILTMQFNAALDEFRNKSTTLVENRGANQASIYKTWGTKLTTFTVKNAAELGVALKTASSGDAILLEGGQYGAVTIQGIKFPASVTIGSKDPGNPAVISTMMVKDSSGINFTNIEFSTVGVTKMGGTFQIVGSSRIEFDKIHVHGSLDGNPGNDVDGFRVLNSTDVKITNSEFEQLRVAIGHRDSDGLVVSGNNIHDIRMDGIRGSGSSDVLISKNYLHDFYRIEGVDHADAIQFYTGNTTKSAQNITITENLIDQGDGYVMQGIFLRDENGTLPYLNVQVSDNIVINGNKNGIAVLGAKNIEVSGNTVVSDKGSSSWIRVNNVEGAVVEGNLVRDDNSAQYLYKDLSGLKESSNAVGAAVSDGGAAVLSKWLEAHPDLKGVMQGFGDVDPSGPQALPLPPPEGGAVVPPPLTSEGSGAGAGGNLAIMDPGAIGHHALDGGAGLKILVGSGDAATVTFGAAAEAVRVDLTQTGLQNALGGGKVQLVNIQNLIGSDGNDTLGGTSEGNILVGGAGNDKLVGGVGADSLFGGVGADSFHVDALSHSTVDPAGRDTIFDFRSAEGDRILVRAIDAVSGGGDDPFQFVAKFTGVAGQLTSVQEGNHYVVMGDVDGDAHADFAINVFSQTALTRGDFGL